MICETAPAKINLYLHVGPLRPDRLHDLASFFVFAEEGDRIHAAPASGLTLAVKGEFAEALAPFPLESNLVLKAARALQSAYGVEQGAALTLDKRLPVAAGIGGGSADAAAALRALCALWRLDPGPQALAAIAFRLGADVPACLAGRSVSVTGAGERLSGGHRLPPFWVCLVNPRVEMPTGPVFRAFDAANPAPPAPSLMSMTGLAGVGALAERLRTARNDLEPHAILRAPVIGSAIKMLSSCPGCHIARMSGSGATVFGMFASREAAERAARRSAAEGWWAMASQIAGGVGRNDASGGFSG